MTPQQYRHALTTLSLTNDQAAIWLGVGRSTAFRYAKDGPSGPAARAVGMAVGMLGCERYDDAAGRSVWDDLNANESGRFVRHSDLTAALALPLAKPPSSVE